MMMDCDTLLTVGSNFPYSQFMPPLDKARAVQIDVDGALIGMRYPYEVNLVGDSRETLRRLLPLLRRHEDRGWRETIEDNMRRWWDVMERRAMTSADPVNPELVFHELSPRLPDDAIIASDSGSAANWYARHITMRGTMRGSLSGTLATMGPGVPYAVGAKFGNPSRPCVALVGDGAMQMNGINELITIAKYWRDWADPRLVVGVLRNDDLNQVTWELRAMGGSPQFLPSQHLPTFPYAGYAQSLGLHGILVEKPEDVVPAWEEALSADRPCVLEFVTDPAVPPIPPHASWDQIQNAAEAFLRGDSDRLSMVKEGIKSKVQEVFPGSKDHPDEPDPSRSPGR
jgi:pyruvate dehydrogenase (quinone)